MNSLLVNTANDELVIVVYKDGEIFACNEKGIKRHNEEILTKLQEVLDSAGIGLKDVDEYGVVIGPGSFTGIRVGIATIKAFKDVFNKPVRAINNLDLLFEIAKIDQPGTKFVAIEGSLNSYFVGKVENDKLNIYERNLTEDELKALAGENEVVMYSNSHNYSPARYVEFSNMAFVNAFLSSASYDLTPKYYQLSQAENDKINNAELNIREAEVWDIKTITELDQANFDNSWSEDMLEKMLISKRNVVYVGEVNKDVVGFAVAENDVDEINVSRVVVSSNYRNHGIGSKLVAKVEELAKSLDMHAVSLEVSENNFTAKTLYEKLGYVLRRIRKGYYKDGSDALEMVKHI